MPYVGCVVGGLVTQGIITEGMTLNLGPFEDGTFRPVIVTSIKRNRTACRLVRATQSAALAIDVPVSEIRRGMVLVDTRAKAMATMWFKVCTKIYLKILSFVYILNFLFVYTTIIHFFGPNCLLYINIISWKKIGGTQKCSDYTMMEV